jgi:hypothetical protein
MGSFTNAGGVIADSTDCVSRIEFAPRLFFAFLFTLLFLITLRYSARLQYIRAEERRCFLFPDAGLFVRFAAFGGS